MILPKKVLGCALASTALLFLPACGGGSSGGASAPPSPPPPAPASLFVDVTASQLPANVTSRACMDVQAVDFDNDADVDLALAIERGSVVLLRNDGTGRFSDVSNAYGVLDNLNDHEDLSFADLDGDGDLDFAVAAEDTMVHELYINQGGSFAGRLLSETSIANAVLAFDFDHDNDKDLIFAGEGLLVLQNDGTGIFTVYLGDRLPAIVGVMQDVAAVDVDKDADLDLVFAIEGQNRLLTNDGAGNYSDATAARLLTAQDESRVAILGDVNGDSFVDLFVGNVQQEMVGVNISNALYLNDGTAKFTTVSTAQLGSATYGAAFVDFDADGDNDLLTASANLLQPDQTRGFRLLRNNAGSFSDITVEAFGMLLNEQGFAVASGDFNRDGKTDLYLCSRGTSQGGVRVGGNDHLMFRR